MRCESSRVTAHERGCQTGHSTPKCRYVNVYSFPASATALVAILQYHASLDARASLLHPQQAAGRTTAATGHRGYTMQQACTALALPSQHHHAARHCCCQRMGAWRSRPVQSKLPDCCLDQQTAACSDEAQAGATEDSRRRHGKASTPSEHTQSLGESSLAAGHARPHRDHGDQAVNIKHSDRRRRAACQDAASQAEGQAEMH